MGSKAVHSRHLEATGVRILGRVTQSASSPLPRLRAPIADHRVILTKLNSCCVSADRACITPACSFGQAQQHIVPKARKFVMALRSAQRLAQRLCALQTQQPAAALDCLTSILQAPYGSGQGQVCFMQVLYRGAFERVERVLVSWSFTACAECTHIG